MSTPLQIRVKEGTDAGRTVPLIARDIDMGRGDPNQNRPDRIYFADPTVSRLQASLHWDDTGGCYILEHHEGATNPTSINLRHVQRQAIECGDSVRMGRVVFVVEAVAEEDLPTVEVPYPDDDEFPVPEPPATETLVMPSPDKLDKPDKPPEPRTWQTHAPYVLVVEEGDGRDVGSLFPLTEEMMAEGNRLFLGSVGDHTNDIVLHDASMPNAQAILHFRDGAFRLMPVADAPPVVVNGMHLQGAWLLRPGDRIQMGQTVLCYRATAER